MESDSEDDSDDSDDIDGTVETPKAKKSTTSTMLRKAMSAMRMTDTYNEKPLKAGIRDLTTGESGFVTGHTEGVAESQVQKLRTLQRYRSGKNTERMDYMERHSPLTKRKLAVSAEQVSIFLTSGKSLYLPARYVLTYHQTIQLSHSSSLLPTISRHRSVSDCPRQIPC